MGGGGAAMVLLKDWLIQVAKKHFIPKRLVPKAAAQDSWKTGHAWEGTCYEGCNLTFEST